MINNRQGGRRRGRGGGNRPSNNAPNMGNRQENRSRGNAAQLHEKYKALARDAQLSGDRVQTEYYLQFADHYFRVLSEGRARFEEQNAQRRQRDDYSDEDEGDEEAVNASDEREDEEERQEQRADRGERDRSYRNGDGRRPQRGRRERAERNGEERGEEEGEERIALDSLPPAISVVEGGNADEEEAPRARRRTRRPRSDDGDAEIAPAA